MSYLTWALRQTATYWAPGGTDIYGNPVPSSPVHIKCRWEAKQELFTDEDGQERRSQAKVFLDRPVQTNGYLALGQLTGTPQSHDNALVIKSYNETPDLKAKLFEYKVWLV